MKAYQKLLLQNQAWAKQKSEDNPDFFEKSSISQTPQFLWIGCSDSRVPANEITDSEPGQIFVHRNIANMVVHTDLNLLSVLQYAVEFLKVSDIIVCGHYGCGGIKAAMSRQHLGLINKWIRNIKEVYKIHQNEIDVLQTEELRLNRVTELNVIEQAMNLAKTGIIQRYWKQEKRPIIHGWVYGLHDGIIHELVNISWDNNLLDPIFTFDIP
ncbi:MAG: carbonic anhydrase [Chitinophagaceae bacterium]|nr:carbonic anhydrase [Chitinophagaceae bacterium]